MGISKFKISYAIVIPEYGISKKPIYVAFVVNNTVFTAKVMSKNNPPYFLLHRKLVLLEVINCYGPKIENFVGNIKFMRNIVKTNVYASPETSFYTNKELENCVMIHSRKLFLIPSPELLHAEISAYRKLKTPLKRIKPNKKKNKK